MTDLELLDGLETYLDGIDSLVFELTEESEIDRIMLAAHAVVAELKRRALCNTVTLH